MKNTFMILVVSAILGAMMVGCSQAADAGNNADGAMATNKAGTAATTAGAAGADNGAAVTNTPAADNKPAMADNKPAADKAGAANK